MIKDLLLRGETTKADVDKLVASIGIPKENDMIKYSAIESELGLRRNTFRWRTVVNAWRKKLYRENNVLFEAIRNEGFKCLDPTNRVSWSSNKINTGRKMIFKGINVAQATDISRLDEETKRLHKHIVGIPERLRMAKLVESKELPV